MSNTRVRIESDLTDEELGYRLVKGSRNYYISKEGFLARKFARGTFNKLTAGKHPTGYLQHHLLMNTGKRVTRTVHSLVAEAFIGPRPEGLVINHKNGVKTDNRFENLEYITRSENTKHGIRIGMHKHTKRRKGEGSHNSVLTDDVVKIICECQSLTYNQLAHVFAIDSSTVTKIKKGKAWKHISGKGVQLLLFPQLN